MPGTIEFIFDIGGPNAYLAYKALPEIIDRSGATLRYVPCLLGGIFRATNNRPPLVRYAEIPAKWAYEQLEMRRFIDAHGLNRFRLNPYFPVNTLALMRTAVAAEEAGVLEPFIAIGMASMWEAGDKLDEPDVIARVLSEGGLDGAALVARSGDQTIKDKLVANTDHAVARGAFGVPTFFVGDEMFFGKERLGQVEAALR